MVRGEAEAMAATAEVAPPGRGIMISAQQQGQHFSPQVAGGMSVVRTERPRVSATAMRACRMSAPVHAPPTQRHAPSWRAGPARW